MLLKYFGLQEDPFGITPDPRCLYPSPTHREALASMEYGLQSNRGFTAMIAPPGMGKTTLLFRFLEGLRESARTVFLFDIDAECEPREFVGYILRDLGITPAQTSFEMHEQLSDALVKENRAGRKVVVVIDEAQNLSDAVLERVRLLTNFETSRGKLMQIVLSGQPQLSEKLLKPSLTQLLQRISTICRLEPLSPEETIAYIDFRLKHAGYKGEPLFTEEALRQIAEASQGIPRTINNLCFNAMSLCRALNCRKVESSMVAEVIADLRLTPKSEKAVVTTSEVAPVESYDFEDEKPPHRNLKRLLLATAALVVLSVAGILGLSGLRTSASHRTNDERLANPKPLSASIAAPVAANSAESDAAESDQSQENFQVIVQPDQRLQAIAEQYLGGFDLQRLRQIQALNPKLTDPDHIEVGQKIWLPGPPAAPMTKDVAVPASTRQLP
jgi:general secretion pathway protein A